MILMSLMSLPPRYICPNSVNLCQTWCKNSRLVKKSNSGAKSPVCSRAKLHLKSPFCTTSKPCDPMTSLLARSNTVSLAGKVSQWRKENHPNRQGKAPCRVTALKLKNIMKMIITIISRHCLIWKVMIKSPARQLVKLFLVDNYST